MHEHAEILCVDDEPQVVEGLKDLLEARYQKFRKMGVYRVADAAPPTHVGGTTNAVAQDRVQ